MPQKNATKNVFDRIEQKENIRAAKRVLTVAGDLWEGYVEFNGHLFLAATVDDQGRLEMNGAVVDELSN